VKTLASALALGFVLLGAGACETPTVQAYFKALPTGVADAVPAYDQLLAVTDQIPGLSGDELTAALPSIFSAMSTDGPAGIQAAFALSVVSRRPDASAILKNYLPQIASLLDRSDSRLKATASLIFVRMNPPPTQFALPILAQFVAGTGSGSEKAQAVWGMIKMAPADIRTEGAVLSLLGGPLDQPSLIAVLSAAGDPTVTSPKIIAGIAHFLTDKDEQLVVAAIQAIGRIGAVAVTQTLGALSALSVDQGRSDTVRRLASETIQHNASSCRTLVGAYPAGCTK
jgi:hypothetical protein